MCPRGSALAELFGHPRRILSPAVRDDDRLRPVSMPDAIRAVLDAADGKTITLLLDGNLPCEQLNAAVACVSAWPGARLCLVVEPAEEALVLGVDASGADLLSDADLSECDGFLIIGDAFSTNPCCARGVLDRHAAAPRTPVVVLDSAAGSATKFGTRRIDVAPGAEFAALSALAAAAGVASDLAGVADVPAAAAAGQMLANCSRLGVLVAAVYGRTGAWRQIGCLAGQVAAARGGGVALQTAGANVPAAVRLAAQAGTLSLTAALSASNDVKVAVGCDVLGMLGVGDIFAAAAALPNETAAVAQIVLPVAMPGEYGGTYLLGGDAASEVAATISAPAGIETPAGLIAALAEAAGAAGAGSPSSDAPARAQVGVPAVPTKTAAPPALTLLFGRNAALDGCGALTGHASWPSATQPLPELRMSPADADRGGLMNLTGVTVRAGENSLRVRLRSAPELAPGRVVLPEGLAVARALAPSRVEADAVVTDWVSVEVSK